MVPLIAVQSVGIESHLLWHADAGPSDPPCRLVHVIVFQAGGGEIRIEMLDEHLPYRIGAALYDQPVP